MPSWKKIILSGSDAALNTLNVTNSITASVISASQFTGSLFGTSSWANNTISASHALTASYVNTLRQNVLITGSLGVSGSITIGQSGSSNGTLVIYKNTSGEAIISFPNSFPPQNDVGWIKHIESTADVGRMEFRVGDNSLTDPDEFWFGSSLDPDIITLRTNGDIIQRTGSLYIQSGSLFLTGSAFITGPVSSSFSGVGFYGTASWANNTNTASLATRNLLTASVSLNTITFTKGDGSTFPITVDTGSGGTSFTGLEYQVAYFASTNGTPEGADYITAYPPHVEGVALRVGRNAPTVTSPSGSHILKDNRELFTNAKGVESNEPFVILGFGGKNNVDLTATDTYEHPGVDGYSDFTSSKVYNGSLKLAKSLYGLTEANTGKTQLYTDGGIIVKPTSPGFLVGQGGFYIFDSASMQFNTSGSLISPVASASVRLTLATDSSSLSIAVGKNSLTDILYISRSGNDARIAIGGDYRTPKNTLDISGSLRVFTSITASTISASGGITGSDLNIKGFPSVSASLASLASGVGTLQQVTDAGNTTSNAISSSFLGVGFFGTASWAINVVNGGGGGGGGSDSAFLNQSTAATTWSFTHNLGTQYPVITVYDTSGQVIIPQEIDGEDTNNLKIYFPTSQSGYATAVGGTSALTYYSQSLTTASVNLNTITFTKGDSSTFPIVVNTFPYTGSAIISGSLTVTGSTAITGGFEALGIKGSKIQLGTYNVGYDVIGVDTFYITGAGLIISGNMPDQNHHNLLKIGNVEMVDVNTALTTNEFLIHNVNTLRITSGADGGNITTNNQLLKIGGGSFYVYRAGSGDSSGIIQSTANYTTITDTFITLYGLSGSYFNIPSTNEITTLNGTDYLMGFVADPAPTPGLSYKVKASKFIWATGSNQIISGGLTITGSTFISGGLSTQYIDFDINAAPAFSTGRVSWVDDTKTLAIDTDLNNFQIEVGHQNVIRVRNETGTTISRGRVVYLSGSSGNRPLIYTSSYEIDPTSAGTVGLVAADISTSNNGYVISNGLIRDINTTAYTAGAVLYLSSSGQLTTTPSIAPLHSVRLGKVITSAVSGIIHVDVDNGYEIGELHDVVDTSTSTTYGALLTKSGSVWKDGYQLTGSYGLTGSLNATSFTGSLFGTASWATNTLTASYVLNAVSSSFSSTASFTPNAITTASVNLNTITFTKGSGATFNITVDTGSGGGGGGSVTINNNVDNYIITATGTANTLNGEASLQYSSSVLINKGKTLFSSTGVGLNNTTHYFRASGSDTYAGFVFTDPEGEEVFKISGDITTNSNLKVIIGDAVDAGSATKLTIDEASGSVAVTGKFRADSIRMTDVATGANNNGEFRVGSVMADSWSTTGPSFTAGRVVYLSGSGQWAEAVASSTGSSTGVLGVTTVNVNQNEVLLHGVITVSQSLAGFTNGRPVYLATSSAGTITQTAPSSSGHVARYVGYVIDSGSRQVYFNPDFTWIELI